jgi:organic hydroperoxide reductase OsmC/OhrA
MRSRSRERAVIQGKGGSRMSKQHRYAVRVVWTGNRGSGTRDYRAYDRDHEVSDDGKTTIPASSDPSFRGDARRWNSEELLVATLSQCHMLWYLHLCAENGVVVTDYEDYPEGVMVEERDGSGRFKEVTLRPKITARNPEAIERARELHHDAHRLCFIANSVNFPVATEPEFRIEANRVGVDPRASEQG